ncbi:O-methyltransferase [bacterium]|nr:O-methyltransferase [bacterium]
MKRISFRFILVIAGLTFLTGDRAGIADESSNSPADLSKAPLAKNDREKQILDILIDLDKQRSGNWNVPDLDGRLLRILAESIDAKHVVELGTSNGYSTLWLALATEKTDGKITTFEIDEAKIVAARANFARAGVEKRIAVISGDAHEEVKKQKEPIDLLFLDADKEGYLDYLEKLLPHVRPGGLILSHNMNAPKPDPRFVEAITNNPALETVFVNMHAAGMAITLKKR